VSRVQPHGRLAGFTNQDAAYTIHQAGESRHPYVLAHGCDGTVAVAGAATIKSIEEKLDQEMAQKERERRLEVVRAAPQGQGAGKRDAVSEYQHHVQSVLIKNGEGVDLSHLDFLIAKHMVKSGRYTVKDVERGMTEVSLNVQSAQAGHMQGYAQRTVAQALASPDVVQHRQAEAQAELLARWQRQEQAQQEEQMRQAQQAQQALQQQNKPRSQPGRDHEGPEMER